MKPLSILLIVFSIFLWLFGFWYSGEAVADPMTAVGAYKFNKGTIAPEFNIENLAGDPVRLGDFRGKVVLLDFWATW